MNSMLKEEVDRLHFLHDTVQTLAMEGIVDENGVPIRR
jgi:hypothetical protein